MKNIKFNTGKYYSVFGRNMFDTIEENGQIIITQKPIKEIIPACQYFDFEIEEGDIILIYVGSWLSEYYITDAPEGWPGKYASFKLDPGIYHARITHVYNGVIFYKIEEQADSYENVLDIRNGWPSSMYFDIKDLPESNIKYISIYDTLN